LWLCVLDVSNETAVEGVPLVLEVNKDEGSGLRTYNLSPESAEAIGTSLHDKDKSGLSEETRIF
jgi:hypothetical protein